jgi:hypothetical protein
MEMVTHDPKAAKRVGVSTSVGREFVNADKGKKFKTGGEMKKPSKLFKGKETYKEELNEAKAIKSGKLTPKQYAMGEESEKVKMKKGGKVKKYSGADGVSSVGRGGVKVKDTDWTSGISKGIAQAREDDMERSRRRNTAPTLGPNQLDESKGRNSDWTSGISKGIAQAREDDMERSRRRNATPTLGPNQLDEQIPKAKSSMVSDVLSQYSKSKGRNLTAELNASKAAKSSDVTSAPEAKPTPRSTPTTTKKAAPAPAKKAVSRPTESAASRASRQAAYDSWKAEQVQADAGDELPVGAEAFKKGGKAKCMKTGGSVRGHGAERTGRTRGKYI